MKGEQQIQPGETDEFAWHASENPLPESADVAIIGGGIIGSSTAYFLAQSGVSVALFEKGRIAGEQSGRNWGWVRQQCRSPVELPLMMQSLRLWKELPAQLGEDVGFRQGGTLYLAEDAKELEALGEWLAVAREHELDTKILAGRELKDVFAGGERWSGALYTASDGRAEPSRAARAIARGAARAGARILGRTAVRGIETAAGRVSAVVTEHGRVATRAVVCAAGAWTRLFCGSIGIRVPQLPVLGTVARTAPAPADPRRPGLVARGRDPPPRGRRLYGRAWPLVPAFDHSRELSLCDEVPAGLPRRPRLAQDRDRKRFPPRARDALALAARPGVPLRARARAQSEAGNPRSPPDACGARALGSGDCRLRHSSNAGAA